MNQAYAVTGRVEEQFSTVALTVKTLTLLAPPHAEIDDETIEELVG